MELGINIFKNMNQAAMRWLATLGVITLGAIPLLAAFGVNMSNLVPLVTALILGFVLVIDSGVKSVKMPKGIAGIVNLGVFLIGAAIIVMTLLGLFGVGVPGLVAMVAGFGALGLILALVF